MLRFERAAWDQGAQWIAGLDEAGRGCLAGPVFAGAVAITRQHSLPDVRDSKTLSELQRETLYAQLRGRAIPLGVGQASVAEIEKLNIYQASILAMKRALAALGGRPCLVLIDGLSIPGLPFAQQKVIKGDARCASIAAASIVAKVERDRYMVQMEEEYPGYGFAKHKGYATPEHKSALTELGPCPLHRCSFKPVRELLLGNLYTELGEAGLL